MELVISTQIVMQLQKYKNSFMKKLGQKRLLTQKLIVVEKQLVQEQKLGMIVIQILIFI